MKRVAIIGSSGPALVIADIVQKASEQDLVGFLDPNRNIGEKIRGLPVLGAENDILRLRERHQIDECIVGIGNNFVRAAIVEKLHSLGFESYATAIHPSANIGLGVTVNSGTVICAGACINTDAVASNHCILNTNCTVEHGSRLSRFCSIAPSAVMGGECEIGEYSAIGIGAVIKHGVSVGSNTVVGAGSLLLRSVGNDLVVYGSPATSVRARCYGDDYLV